MVKACTQAAEKEVGPVLVSYNNTNRQGVAWAFHANVLVSRKAFDQWREADWSPLQKQWIPFLVTSLPLVGTGKVGAENGTRDTAFQFSQRADFIDGTVGVETVCRELCQLHPRLRADLLLAAALLHDVGRTVELKPGPGFHQTEEGRLLGHVHLGVRMVEERAGPLDVEIRSELLHAIASHHDARGARTAEAACLYHANQLDALAATRPVESRD